MVLLQGAALGKAAAVTTGWGHKEAWRRGRYCRVECWSKQRQRAADASV